MIKKVFLLLTLFPLIYPPHAAAQFAGGSSVLGVHIGISNVAKATVLGAKFEEEITDGSFGAIGISGKLDFYSYNAGILGNDAYIFGVLSGNYHFRIEDGTLDPFLGIGIGYLSEKNKFPDASGFTYYNTDGSGFQFVFSFGARYYLSQSLALRLEFGTSLVYAVGGFDFSF